MNSAAAAQPRKNCQDHCMPEEGDKLRVNKSRTRYQNTSFMINCLPEYMEQSAFSRFYLSVEKRCLVFPAAERQGEVSEQM